MNFVKVDQNGRVSNNADAVLNAIEEDRHVTYLEIETSLGLSQTVIHLILHEQFALKSFYRWVSHNLTDVKKSSARVRKCNKNRPRTEKPIYSIITGNDLDKLA